jgi:hypothetical protein
MTCILLTNAQFRFKILGLELFGNNCINGCPKAGQINYETHKKPPSTYFNQSKGANVLALL